MALSVLITQCLQRDFVDPIRPLDPLPNRLHVGHAGALRLLGPDPGVGSAVQIRSWARAQPTDQLEIIHIRDWHDADDPRQRDHLAMFAMVFKASSRDALGYQQAPSVVKIGPSRLIGRERMAFERVEESLGNSAPAGAASWSSASGRPQALGVFPPGWGHVLKDLAKLETTSATSTRSLARARSWPRCCSSPARSGRWRTCASRCPSGARCAASCTSWTATSRD